MVANKDEAVSSLDGNLESYLLIYFYFVFAVFVLMLCYSAIRVSIQQLHNRSAIQFFSRDKNSSADNIRHGKLPPLRLV